VRQLADEEASEADAGVVEDGDPHAVRILTVHAAKGLEFPVVIVPECAAPPPNVVQGVLVDPELGLSLKVRGADGRRRWGAEGNRIKEEREARESAQSRRLLYVAATRARDYLIFSGRPPGRGGETWRGWLDAALPQLGGLLRVLPDGGGGADPARPPPGALTDKHPALLRALETGTPVDGAPADAALAAEVERAGAAVARAAARPAGGDATVVAPVTQLADASVCARRYQLLHEIGLEEHPRRGDGGPGAAERGTLAHRLLEVAPLAAEEAELRRLLDLEGADAESLEHAEVLAAARAFLATPLAKRMAAAGAGRLQRELPFALRIDGGSGPGLVMRGQLDALLLDDGEATVVDYKLSRGGRTERYAFQLDAYALAAQALTAGAVPIRTGLVLLRAKGAPFLEDAPRTPEQMERTRTRLREAARTLAHGRRTGLWPKIEPPRCRELECGFVARCHPNEAS
jgi:hypothetical protein